MNKKFLGIKLGTFITVFLLLCFSVVFWLFAKYSLSGGSASDCALKLAGLL